MKKLLLTVIAISCLLPALRADEEAIRKLFKEHTAAERVMDMEKLLSFYHPEFTGEMSNGTRIDYSTLQTMAKFISLMGKEDARLSELMKLAAKVAGKEMSAAELDRFRALDDRPEGKKLVTLMQSQKNAMLAESAAIADSFKLTGLKVDNDKADFVYCEHDAKSKALKETSGKMVKHGGRWLIIRSVTKIIKEL